jgi:HEAT repeat protein
MYVGSTRAVPALLAAAEDPEETVRHLALDALCRIPDHGVAPFLLQSLPLATGYLRDYAIEALGRQRYRAAVPALLAILEDRDDSDGSLAALALGHIGDPAAIPALGEATQAEDRILRERSQEALRLVRRTQ